MKPSMEAYRKIEKQRKRIIAPVDTMGCAIVPEKNDLEIRRFQILISLMLSSQTKDHVTNSAINRLNDALGGLTAKNVCSASMEVLKKCIEKVGFHNRKVVNLVKIADHVCIHGMPDTLEHVLSLPGIGPKMAYLYLSHGCGKNLGIGVDTHVHRISNRIGFLQTVNAEGSRVALEKKFDPSEWMDVNRVLVGFGQTICQPINPKCGECDARFLCPSSIHLKKENKKRE